MLARKTFTSSRMLFIEPVAIYSAGAMFAYGVWFAFISPFFFRRFLAHLPPPDEMVPVAEAEHAEEDLP